uniref:TSA: Wollemia nobilis Ref_Wollemi_Transcript_14440_1464 transcribed RNA sequence n=1 Tax=Wollemia nobilis TaxID=56998 RepID=A0A0C9S3Z8_9CONI
MAGKLMKAVQYSGYSGGAGSLQHVEVPVPTAKKGELLVKLEATSLNPVDWKIQSGILRPFMPSRFPYIPATDIAGEVVDVGPGVEDFKPGDKIVSWLNINSGGGLAEYAVASVKTTVKRPPGVSAEEGASLPIAGLTALQAVRDSAGVKLDGTGKETNLLITAASGGVGHFAVQLAKLGRAHVTATCGARNLNLVKDMGADEVLDYKTPEGAALKSPSGRKYDAVIHCATHMPWSTFQPNLSSNGKVIDITPNFTSFLTFLGKKVTLSQQKLAPLLCVPRASDLALMTNLVEEGNIKPLIDSKYPLQKAEEAWGKIMEGHATGKIIVTFEE